VLPGAGARGAYQVGVLKAIASILPKQAPNPFAVISGTSAGAINAAVLASRADHFERAVHEMEHVWAHFEAAQVYRTDNWTMLKSSAHWFAAVVLGGLGFSNPKSLLDNAPLRVLLERQVRFLRIAHAIELGHLDALAVTASAYTSARSVTFFQAHPSIQPWARVRRIGRPEKIGIDHLRTVVVGDTSRRRPHARNRRQGRAARSRAVCRSSARFPQHRASRGLYAGHAVHGWALHGPRATVAHQ
jgi:NTE family protein